ncbi:Inositol hexakisphosphate and diphosphoinositol-pentakisphosphate kinase 1 [Cichlidogyrus casuarinus]|uniref:Inositol hexakisphosphate and diphosphoinositol-pentakisphosphate kinase n=1 Tax=Cichlidogyrus casuarinus TaxID=1844966 RepID=A0ABD2QGN1_9PLAT
MNRKQVYEVLKRENISVPRFATVERGPGLPEPTIIEHEDAIEIEGVLFQKPFVEKPLSAEEHDINIYFPSSAGGGSQHLFRKVGNLSSKYNIKFSKIRRDRSYIYEEFMATDGTDVKVYTVGDDYAHAEARKSPALDGKVERDHDGKEVRYPVILTPREKIIAKKVSKGFKQLICGFDLLRANGMSYVCDVNGFSFVKSSRKYYDDCSQILAMVITREIAPQMFQVVYGFNQTAPDDTPLVPTTCGTIMELRCVIGVLRHGDRTPKQKMKMEVTHKRFFDLFDRLTRTNQRELKLKRPAQLQEVLDIVREILEDIEAGHECEDNKAKYEQLKYVLEMHGSFSGINRKIQLKYQPKSKKVASVDQDVSKPALLLVAKWGGELTDAGRQQAEELGKAFRCIYPSGDGNYSKDPGLGLLRLHSTYRHDLKIYASDEGRVQMTAAAFAKGFLALEGELPPILVQMVKSANTNGLLDNDNHWTDLQETVKSRIKQAMSKDRDFDEKDFETLVPTLSNSIISAMNFVKNPKETCRRLHEYVTRLVQNINESSTESKIQLYQGESWDLLMRRWTKLLKDFRASETKDFDLSKISDIYDNIKYDVQHNPGILIEEDIQGFFSCAKALADIIVPQEYGITLEDKLLIGQRICTPLMRKILSDARYTEVDECTRLHAGYSKGVASPERFVRTRLYFTSESHLHALITIMRYGSLSDPLLDEQWCRAMEYISSVSELNYLSQIVIMIYEDPSEQPKTPERYHVEVHFSPGAYALCHDIPEGTGFRSVDSMSQMNAMWD